MEKDGGLEAIQREVAEAEAWELLRLTNYAKLETLSLELPPTITLGEE